MLTLWAPAWWRPPKPVLGRRQNGSLGPMRIKYLFQLAMWLSHLRTIQWVLPETSMPLLTHSVETMHWPWFSIVVNHFIEALLHSRGKTTTISWSWGCQVFWTFLSHMIAHRTPTYKMSQSQASLNIGQGEIPWRLKNKLERFCGRSSWEFDPWPWLGEKLFGDLLFFGGHWWHRLYQSFWTLATCQVFRRCVRC